MIAQPITVNVGHIGWMLTTDHMGKSFYDLLSLSNELILNLSNGRCRVQLLMARAVEIRPEL